MRLYFYVLLNDGFSYEYEEYVILLYESMRNYYFNLY